MVINSLKSKEREVILGKIEKAGNEEYVTEWDKEGKIGIQKKKSEIKKGRKSKSSGNQFEARVREDLEGKGWVVDKWSNNVDLEQKKLSPAKRKFNPFSKVMTIGTGFPDFIAFQKINDAHYKIIGVEVKINGLLSREEKLKMEWYLERGIFSEIKVAKKEKEKNKIRIEYIDSKEILERMR